MVGTFANSPRETGNPFGQKLTYFCLFAKFRWQILAIAMSTVVAVFLIGAVFAFVISKKGGCSPGIAYERNCSIDKDFLPLRE